MSLAFGCATPTKPPPDPPQAEANQRTALTVKAALNAELGLAAAAIEVTANDTVVTLGGFTETGEERRRAIAAARRADGVTRVRDRIRVRR